MKRIATALSAFAGLLALTSLSAAQFGPTPDITSIPQRQADSPGNIVINGRNLGLVTEVKIDNVSVPIIRTRTDRIIVGPLAPQLAHFASVRVTGGSSDTGTLSLLPTLSASRRGFAVFPSVNNGDTGTFVLRYSYQADLANAADAGIYGRRFLNLFSTVASVGVFPDANPFALPPFALPIEIGSIGEDLKMQAECSSTSSGLVRYTN
ncbi:MAG: hypothetical protein ABL998_09455, partial [Planctomycetota bacterium]